MFPEGVTGDNSDVTEVLASCHGNVTEHVTNLETMRPEAFSVAEGSLQMRPNVSPMIETMRSEVFGEAENSFKM